MRLIVPHLRPEAPFKAMYVYRKKQGLYRGRSRPESWEKDEEPIMAAISMTGPKEVDKWKQRGHEVSHTIIQQGGLKARPGDKVVYGGNEYTIEGLKDAAKLGVWAVYYCNQKEAEEDGQTS